MDRLKEYREYIILAVIAAALLLFIIFRSAGNMNYDLPEPDTIDYDRVARVTIEGTELDLEFTRSGGNWLIQPEGWIADSKTLESIVKGITEIRVADLISSSGNAELYDLDESMRARAAVYDADGELLRELYVGKISSSGVYTYMMFPGDDNIYSVRGTLPSKIAGGKTSMRSREIFRIPRDSIEKMVMRGPKGTVTLYKDENDEWKSADSGFEADSAKASSALSYLDPTRCAGFLDAPPAGNPEWTIEVSGAGETAELEIWPEADDKKYPARSSQNGYPVLLTKYIAENLLEAFGLVFSEQQ